MRWAWPLAVIIAHCLGPAAALRRLYARDVEYCSPQSLILVERFDFQYLFRNRTLSFDIVAQAVDNEVEAILEIELIVYGISLIKKTLDLCEVSSRTCPLPAYQFDGTASYQLPDELASKVPTVAAYAPNLEATLRVTILNKEDNSVATCIQGQFDNGVSVRNAGTTWAAVTVATVTYLAALAHSSFWPISRDPSAPDWRFSALISVYQHVVVTGMLDMAYPGFYRAFTENFAFSFGLIPFTHVKADLKSFTTRTGGTNVTASTLQGLTDFFSIDSTSDPAVLAQLVLDANNDPSTIPQVPDDPVIKLSGIGAYSNDIGIPPPNASLSAIVSFAFLTAFVLALSLLIFGFIALRYRFPHFEWTQWHQRMASNARSFLISNLQRVLLVSYFPLTCLAFYQFRMARSSGWAAVLIAALTFVVSSATLFGLIWHVAWVARRLELGQDAEPQKRALARRWSVVYDPARRTFYALMAPLMGATVLKAIFVGLLQGYPVAQLVPLLLIEAGTLAVLLWKRPLSTMGKNRVQITLTSVKAASFALMLSFLPSVKASRIAISVIGVIILLLQAVTVVGLAILVCLRFIQGIKWSLQREQRLQAAKENIPTGKTRLGSTTPPGTPSWRTSVFARRRLTSATPTRGTTPPGTPSGALARVSSIAKSYARSVSTTRSTTPPTSPPPPLPAFSKGPTPHLPRITIRAPTAQTLPLARKHSLPASVSAPVHVVSLSALPDEPSPSPTPSPAPVLRTVPQNTPQLTQDVPSPAYVRSERASIVNVDEKEEFGVAL